MRLSFSRCSTPQTEPDLRVALLFASASIIPCLSSFSRVWRALGKEDQSLEYAIQGFTALFDERIAEFGCALDGFEEFGLGRHKASAGLALALGVAGRDLLYGLDPSRRSFSGRLVFRTASQSNCLKASDQAKYTCTDQSCGRPWMVVHREIDEAADDSQSQQKSKGERERGIDELLVLSFHPSLGN
jgi:hypothetical protein